MLSKPCDDIFPANLALQHSVPPKRLDHLPLRHDVIPKNIYKKHPDISEKRTPVPQSVASYSTQLIVMFEVTNIIIIIMIIEYFV